MDDPGPVGGLERVQQPEPEPGGPFRGERPPRLRTSSSRVGAETSSMTMKSCPPSWAMS